MTSLSSYSLVGTHLVANACEVIFSQDWMRNDFPFLVHAAQLQMTPVRTPAVSICLTPERDDDDSFSFDWLSGD